MQHLLSYYRQDKKVKAICLYASQFENNNLEYISEIIDTENLKGDNEQEIFDSWDKSFNKKGIFEDTINVYDFKNIGLTYEDLKDLKESDGGTIFNQFAEILRRHIVSDKTNAFNKIFNLFICKIQDEDDKIRFPKEELQFQVKKNDTSEILFNRLNFLYKKGNENYIDVILSDISEEDFENLLKLKARTDGTDEKLKKAFKELRYYRSSQEFSFKEVYNKETFEENAEIVKEVVKLLENFKIKYSKKHQYLGVFFELLLNTGIKQEAGQFFTPIPLTRFICKSLPIKEIIDRKNNNLEIHFLPYVIDYACGSGHFLIEIMDEIDSYVKNIKEKDIKGPSQAVKNFKSLKEDLLWSKKYVYGIEKDYRLVKTSKVSSFLNGDGDANVMSTDGLAPFTNRKYKDILKTEENQKENPVFDILVANPPYSVSGFKNNLVDGNECFDLYNYLTDKSSEIECLFVERTKQLLKENGVAGVVLPISILSNGGIYTKTRELLLKYFDIKAIVSLGSNAFMATGTKTIILFMQRKNNLIHSEIDKYVNDFLGNYNDITVNNIQNAFSIYVKNVYEDLNFNDYVSILKDELTDKAKQSKAKQSKAKQSKAKQSEIYKEYKGLSQEEIIKVEKQKLFYFLTAYPQKIVLGDSKDKAKEKEFYGYEFSNRRGCEGIHIDKDEEGNVESKLYNAENLEDTEKMNSYILNNFKGKDLEKDIEDLKQLESHPLKEHIDYLRLSDLMTFDLKTFDNSINLNNKKKLKLRVSMR
ncbi:MAG: SAM-dependent DNA methyltransferase [bacterium]|nr:SAM-dependent DNA methyltransferase [bacterium]